jgi:lipopolysaccharide export system ATP-binding protein
MTNILDITNISFRTKTKTLVHNFSLSIHQGEIHGLLGPNGAGKTTTFHLIAGLLNTHSGKIKLYGNDITHLDLSGRCSLGLGFMAQERTLFPEMTVKDNIFCALELNRTSIQQQNTLYEKILQQLQIKPIENTRASALSGGEARRTELARILAKEPKVLLMDEPFAGVDPKATSDIKALIHYLSKLGISILLTDHNAREILTLCDRITIIKDGTTLITGTKKEVISSESANLAYLNGQFDDLLLPMGS